MDLDDPDPPAEASMVTMAIRARQYIKRRKLIMSLLKNPKWGPEPAHANSSPTALVAWPERG